MSIDFVVLARFYLDSGPEALSDTPVTHPSWDYEGRVLQWGFIERSIPSPIGLPRIGDAKIRIADTDRKFRDLLAVQTPRRRFVELKILEVGTSEAATDPIYRGECVNMSFGPGYCEATLRDRTYAWIDELIPNLINRVNFPNLAQGTDEAFFPIVNGECLSPTDNPQGVIALPHIGLEVSSPPMGDRYAAAIHPIEGISVYRKLPEAGTFTLVNPDEYAVTEELTAFAELPTLDVNPTFIDFIVQQPEGTQIRADILGINFRGEWNGIPVANTFQENRNPINFFINMIFVIMAKAGQSDSVWDVDSISDTLDAFEVMLDTPSGPDRLKCDGAIVNAQTAREWLGNFLPNFQLDMYQKKNGKLAIAYVEDTNPSRHLFTAGRDVEINSFMEEIASPTVNQCRYHFAKNFASGDFAENQIYDNTGDQFLLGPLYNDFGSPIMRVDKFEVDDFNFDFVRDPETALFAITRHMSFLALGSYRQTWSMDLVESMENLELASLIGLTHFDGLAVGGYVNAETKVLGLTIDLDKMKVTVRSILRVPQQLSPFDPSFSYYSAFIVNEGQVPSTQTDFPVGIVWTDDRFKSVSNGGHVESEDGFDIRPYSASGIIPKTFELVWYDPVAGSFEMWVLMDSIEDGDVIRMKYGNPTLITDGSSTDTWPSEYKGVWHYGSPTALNFADSTANGNDGTGVNTPTVATGQMGGGAVAFVLASAQTVTVPDALELELTRTTPMTWELMFKRTSDAPNAQPILDKRDLSFLGMERGWLIYIHSSPTPDILQVDLISHSGTDLINCKFFGRVVVLDEWTYAMITYDGSGLDTGTVIFLADSVSQSLSRSGSLTDPTESNAVLSVGGFDGALDEVRISKGVARTPDYATTSSNNQKDMTAFWTFDAEVPI